MWMDKYQYYLQHGPTFKWCMDNVALSRAGCPDPADPEGEAGVEEVQTDRTQLARARGVRSAQEEDRVLSRIRDWVGRKHCRTSMEVKELQEDGATYIGFSTDLVIGRDGILRRQLPARAIEPRERVLCIPESLREEAIRVAHVNGGHMGIGTTVERLRRKVYFPHMRAEVEDYIKACSICQRKTRKNADQRHTLVSPTVGYPFQRLHIDLVGPLYESFRSHAKYILMCRDAFSKWPEAFALKEIVRTLEKEIFA